MSPMSPLCVVQARTGSSRLPGKVLLDLGGRPVLALLLLRLQRGSTPVVVATSTAPGDDQVARLADVFDVSVVRGSEADVLDRFRLVAETWPDADPLVRITADCPFTDPEVIERALAVHAASGADYTSNTLSRTYPDGLDVEVVARPVLLAAAAEATEPEEREHVTPFLQRHPDRFRLAAFCSGDDLGDRRLTLDTAEDLARLRTVVGGVADHVQAGWRSFVGDRPARGEVEVRPQCAEGLLTARRFAVVVGGREVAQVVVDLHPDEPAVVEGHIPTHLHAEILRLTSLWLAMDLHRGPLESLTLRRTMGGS